MIYPRTREMRPARGASSAHVVDAAMPTVLRDALAGLADSMGWYEAGILYGDGRGYQRCLDDFHARAEMSAGVAHLVSSAGPYADLAERRGQPERAAAQRATLAERGISL